MEERAVLTVVLITDGEPAAVVGVTGIFSKQFYPDGKPFLVALQTLSYVATHNQGSPDVYICVREIPPMHLATRIGCHELLSQRQGVAVIFQRLGRITPVVFQRKPNFVVRGCEAETDFWISRLFRI